MKIIQISDLHLVLPGERLAGLDPLARLRACIADINEAHADADLVVTTGDLAERGEREVYATLRDELTALRPPYRLTLGNHDRRDTFLEVFPEHAGKDGFVQSVIDFPEVRVVILDTLDAGEVGGRLGAERLDWLDRQLATAGRDCLLFMHHPPFDVFMPVLDRIKLADAAGFLAVLKRHDTVRHIFAGHVHRMIAGSWHGIPFSVLRGTNHQTDLDFSPDRVANTLEAPLYAVILANANGVVMHVRDFTDRTRFFA